MDKSIIYIFKSIIILLIMIMITSCEDILKEDVFDEVAKNNFFQNDEDAVIAVNAIYATMRNITPEGNTGWGMFSGGTWSLWTWQEAPTDEVYVIWDNAHWNGLNTFTFPTISWYELETCFADLYEAIAMANNVIDNMLIASTISPEMQKRVLGEAYCGRALFYIHTLSIWGNIPLLTTFNPDPKFYPFQAPRDTVASQIISDLLLAEEYLPDNYSSSADYGRFTKDAARALLARFYLNEKRWQEAADKTKEVIDNGVYKLSPDYYDIFSPNNEGNSEIIISLPSLAQTGLGNTFLMHTTPGDYNGFPGWNGYRIRTAFYETFDPSDIRRQALVSEYTTIGGGTKEITDGYLILKYSLDENAAGEWAGNDIVIHRYAEVLLTRAEALNELDGPNQESIDLINELRNRAFPDDTTGIKEVTLSNLNTKEALREHILAERGWELYAEGYRRDDLIRQEVFISRAIARGANAQPYHLIYPIPQIELDRNPNLIQNPGY